MLTLCLFNQKGGHGWHTRNERGAFITHPTQNSEDNPKRYVKPG